MPRIIVDEEQARIISESVESIEICDRDGRHLGYVAHGFTEEDIEIAKQRRESDEPRFTTQQVLDHVQSLVQP